MAKQTKIYVSANIYDVIYACGSLKFCNGPTENAVEIKAIRNPSFYSDDADYQKSLLKIVDELRSVLNEPYLSLNIYEVNYLYFEPRTNQ